MASQAEIARHLDLSQAAVSQLIRDDILPTAPRGEFDVDACRVAYIRHLRNAASGRSSGDGEKTLTAARVAGVTIERLPYAEFIDRYDRPGTLFYLDPPYRGSEGYYGKGVFGAEDFERLADQLRRIKGRLILSINDTPDTRRIFGRFAIEAVGTTYTVAGGAGAKRAGELIVTDC